MYRTALRDCQAAERDGGVVQRLPPLPLACTVFLSRTAVQQRTGSAVMYRVPVVVSYRHSTMGLVVSGAAGAQRSHALLLGAALIFEFSVLLNQFSALFSATLACGPAVGVPPTPLCLNFRLLWNRGSGGRAATQLRRRRSFERHAAARLRGDRRFGMKKCPAQFDLSVVKICHQCYSLSLLEMRFVLLLLHRKTRFCPCPS